MEHLINVLVALLDRIRYTSLLSPRCDPGSPILGRIEDRWAGAYGASIQLGGLCRICMTENWGEFLTGQKLPRTIAVGFLATKSFSPNLWAKASIK